MKPTLIAISIVVLVVSGLSIRSFLRERDARSSVQLTGAGFLLVVVLAHIAEAFHLFPAMGWGLPNSAGHYVDLVSAIAGTILLVAGYLARVQSKRRNSN